MVTRFDGSRMIVAALGLTLLGQADPLYAYATPAYGEPVGMCRLGIAAPREPERAGGEVRLEVVLEHLGERPDIGAPMGTIPSCMGLNDWQTDVELHVVDERGIEVSPTRMGRATKPRGWMRYAGGPGVAPGYAQPLTRLPFGLLFDMTLAGRYRARITRPVFVPNPDGPYPRKRVLLTSGEVEFELVEPPEDR